MVNPVLVALDLDDRNSALAMARALQGSVGGFKVGLELMMSVGPSIVNDVSDLGLPVFADAKLHDIPNTVRASARALASRGARWVTVHSLGGGDMLEAANVGLAEGATSQVGALAVTVLTSLDDDDLSRLGLDMGVGAATERLIEVAEDAQVEGVICSPLEARLVKSKTARLKAVTPGIRPAGEPTQDQKRTATPLDALKAGADYLVVGRAITSAPDPVAMAGEIAASIADLR